MCAALGQPRIKLEELWRKLEEGLRVVYAHESMTARQYMEYYTLVFKFCTQQPNKPTDPRISADALATELYEKAQGYNSYVAVEILQKGRQKSGEDLLNWYHKEWVDYRFCSAVVDGIFSYLNRHWVRRMIDEGKVEVYTIQTLQMRLWKDALFSILGNKVTDAVLEQIRRERCGEPINKTLLKSVLTSYVEMGITDDVTESGTQNVSTLATKQAQVDIQRLCVYKDRFEAFFINATQTYYETEAMEFLSRNSVVEYMKKVEKRLLEEEDRANFYLHNTTLSILNKSVEDVMITRRIELFQSQFGPLLEMLAKDDLKRMYDLCSRVDKGLENLRVALQHHIVREGKTAIGKHEVTADKDPKGYVMALLEIHERYSDLIKEAFKNEQGFNQSLDKAANVFINQNAVTVKRERHNPSKTPELLARTCDAYLKKSSKMLDESELEVMLGRLMVIFKYVEDKDIFAKIHTKLFSKRLIGETSASEEGEVSLIGKLKSMCGFEYTQRMTKMVSDMQTSVDLNAGYKDKHGDKFAKEKLPDFTTLVISTGSWPSIPPLNAILPEVVNRHVQLFIDFYTDKYTGRKLTWAFSQAKGELSAHCFSSKKIFVATAAQITILMLYNRHTTLRFEEIAATAGIDKKTTALTLAALIKAELIKGEDLSTKTDFDDQGDQQYEINLGYKNKKVKIDLMKCVVRPADAKQQEDKEITKSVEEDRRNVIQACIVRIMKMRKTIKHQQLMVEVLEQLQGRFKPRVDSVKKCIGILIEKDYMKRSEESRDIYEYIS